MPSKLKAILPGKFNSKVLFQSLEKDMTIFVDEVDKVFKSTVKDFTTKPDFEKKVEIKPGKIEGSVLTSDENYKRLNDGTKPHVILPKKPGGVLVFKINFKSKTTLTRLPSRRGFNNAPVVFARKVNHPGFEPRNYEERVKKEVKPKFSKIINKHLDIDVKKSGHNI